MPTLYVVAGPNGSGKSTLTRTARFRRAEVIDPDTIARGMASGTLVEAGREALRRRRAALAAGRTHLVETTLAGSGVILHMNAARTAGYRIELHYVSLESADQTLLRIGTRVAQGGHDVPEPDVRRRFARSPTCRQRSRGPTRRIYTTTAIPTYPTARSRSSLLIHGGLRKTFRHGRPRQSQTDHRAGDRISRCIRKRLMEREEMR